MSLLAISACFGTSGPIKAYDTATVQGTPKISILYLPPAIELLEIDGVEYESPYIETGFNEVHLLPGKHVVTIKYVKYWGDGTAGSMISSKPILFKLETKGGEKLTVNYTRPKDQWSAQIMVNRFKPWIENNDNKKSNIKGSQFYSGSLALTGRSSGVEGGVKTREPLSELKFWWDKATYAEKEEFKKWLDSD
ncbi:MAG: DUF2057 domain-containing protein [Gammaproteobacteria bacterium]|nr:DUF2057 domain-containing protein [Gammaproteobacteria bacterium]